MKNKRVLQIGIGGLGSALALNLLGSDQIQLTLLDSDEVELSNLHRQILYGLQEIGTAKSEAAKRILSERFPGASLETRRARLNPENAEKILSEFDLVIDAVDRFQAKFFLNDLCVSLKKPLIYGAAIRWEGRVLPIDPEKGPCLRCLFPEIPPAKDCPTATTVGVIGPVPSAVALFMAGQAKRFLAGQTWDAGTFFEMNFLEERFRKIKLTTNPDCPLHAGGKTWRDFLADYQGI